MAKQEQSSTTFQPVSVALDALQNSAESFRKTQAQVIEVMQRFTVRSLQPVSSMIEQAQREPSPALAPAQPFSMALEALQKNAQLSWTTQTHVLDKMQLYAEGWFQRRHAGVQAGQEACARMCAAKTPVECFHAYQLWSMGAFQRLLADGLVFRDGMKTIVSEMTPPLAPETAKERGKASDSRIKIA